MRKFIQVSALLTCISTAGCMPTTGYNSLAPFHDYLLRANTITMSAGNAQEVNTRIHEIDPWPQYAGNTRIVGNGERMAGAVERYRDASKVDKGPPPLALTSTNTK